MTSNERKILFLVCFSDFGVNTISAKLVIGNHVVDFVLIWAHILFGYHYLVMNGNNMRYGSYMGITAHHHIILHLQPMLNF